MYQGIYRAVQEKMEKMKYVFQKGSVMDDEMKGGERERVSE